MTEKNDGEKREIEEYLAKFDKMTENLKNRISGKSPNDAGDSLSSRKTAEHGKPDDKKASGTIAGSGSGTDSPAERIIMNSTSHGSVTSRGKTPRRKRILKLLLGAFVALCLFMAFYSFTVIANAPKIDPNNIYSYLSESSVLYDDEGNIIDNVSVEGGNRINVDYDEMPKNLINAVVSIEDKTFWTHHGFNVIRMFGAIKDSLISGDRISGTSTVTQQLARNVYLAETKQDRSLSRKITEAYYTVLLESSLTKKQIIEAYLNTIYLGYNCYGVESASQAYFSKDVKDLDLLECASLAAIPKSPDTYALLKLQLKGESSGSTDSDNILSTTSDYNLVYNGNASKERRDTTLKFMHDQGYITTAQEKAALNKNLKSEMDPSMDSLTGLSAYFCDYTISQVIDDLMDEYNYTESEASQMVYQGGLKIYTTMNSKAQNAIEDTFNDSSNFPSVANLDYDSDKNILNDDGNILLYAYDNYFNSDDEFTLRSSEYKSESDGSMLIKKGKRLNFYATKVNSKTDYSIEFKSMYKIKKGVFYTIESGALSIPRQYKSLDDDGNMIISAQFFKDYPDFFTKSGDNMIVKDSNYSLKQEVRQPQAAMVITDYKTGQIKAMAGGRNTTGRQLYNRATAAQQPGSSIKPLSVYSSALQQGADAAAKDTPMTFTNYDKNQKTKYYGDYWTAASLINDAPLTVNGKVWPKNWYSGYKGLLTLRKSVEQSVNVNAVRVFQQVGADYAVKQLKKFGITTVVDDTSASANDMNAAALALGGMTKGISPLQMSSAFGTFPNQGKYIEPVSYTKIKNKNGETLLNKTSKSTQVIDKGVAFIMTDILRTTVTNGIASGAAISGRTVAGKTGTTTDNYDAWFCGFTPQYSAALWIGNDVNIELSTGSAAAATLWSKVMSKACSGMSGSFPSKPSDVITSDVSGQSEYYIKGTQEGVVAKDSEAEQVTATVCKDTGYLATPWCSDTETATLDSDDVHAKYYCYEHNLNTDKYPIDPDQTLNKDFVWVEPNNNNDEDVVDPGTDTDNNNSTNTNSTP